MLAHRITTAVPFDDPLAQAFASRNEHHVAAESPTNTLIAALAVVAVMMLGGYAVAGVTCVKVVASMLGVLIAADVFSEWCDDARKVGYLK